MAQQKVIGFEIMQEEKNAVKAYACQFLKELPALPGARHMHQSVVLYQSTSMLYVIGGKTSKGDWSYSAGAHMTNDWTNSVIQLDLEPYFKKGISEIVKGKSVKKVSQWKECTPMKYARANFAAVSFGPSIYVFGGLSGGDHTNSH